MDSHVAPEVEGLPTDLPSGASSLLFDGGRQLAIATGSALTLYRMVMEESRIADKPRALQLPGTATGLAESALGLIVSVEDERTESALLLLAADRELQRVHTARSAITALAAAGGYAYIATRSDDRHGATLARIDLRRRAVEDVVSLDSAVSHLAVDAAGERVVVSDRGQRRVLVLGANLAPLSVPPPRDRHTHDRPIHAHGCGCALCCVRCGDVPPPHGKPDDHGRPPDDHERPPDGSGGRPDDPARPPDSAGHDPAGHDPARPPGQVGVPTDDGGVAVGDGGRVDLYPPGGIRNPCGAQVFWEVAVLRKYGGYLLAVDNSGRQAALLSHDLNVIKEWNLGRGGAHFVASAGAPTLLMLQRSTRRWIVQRLDRVAVTKAGLDLYPIIIPETKTFIGQQTYALSHDKNRPKLPLRTLLLPVVEGLQAFSSPNLKGFAAFMNRTMVPYAKDFHVENSFGAMKGTDLEFTIFGETGGPLKLPRERLGHYYFPTYVAARVELTKGGVTGTTPVVFDGRESLSIAATAATGSNVSQTVVLPFFSLAFESEQDQLPQVKFLGSEQLVLQVTAPDGAARTLTLVFTPLTINIPDEAAVVPRLADLENYLETVFLAAEAAAGVPARLFAKPKAHRIKRTGLQFGRLLVTVAAANTSGTRLTISSTAATIPGGDPIGLASPIRGTMTASSTSRLERYLDNALLLAQDATTFIYNNRLFEMPDASFDSAKGELKITIKISNRYGGPGAAVSVAASNALEVFGNAVAHPNSASSFADSEALRDRGQLYQDALTAAVDRQQAEGKPIADLTAFGCVLVMPVEPGIVNAADPDAVRPDELWNIAALDRPFDFRGAENQTTVEDGKKRIDPKTGKPLQVQAGWSLIFMSAGKPDNPLIVHELGHVLNFADLYKEPPNYRDDLAYMNEWAMMNWHNFESHHCGYHKLQANWIPYGAETEQDYGRVFPIGLPDPPPPGGGGPPKSWELLLVPVELWRDSLVASARTAFGAGPGTPVVQLATLDLGGDGSTFVLLEARQPGARFSKKLPGGGGVLITNGITWNLDARFAHANQYRRPLHLLNPANILRNAGDRFDLAFAPELALVGTVVEVLDKKTVEGDVVVYRVKVTRENAEFVDLYFDQGNPYYKSPDLWIDWAGNNGPGETYSDKESDIPKPALGTPTDQGEAIRVHPTRNEHNWIVARVRNRGKVKALDVKLDFYICDPPGGGDRGKNFKQMGTANIAEVPGGDQPEQKGLRWDVPSGASGHSCLLVRIEDYKIPTDSAGAQLGSDDNWPINNNAQKNVDTYEALKVNPYDPVTFDFSVHNAGVTAEVSYLEPEHLPFGMTLAVSPPRQLVPAGATVLFHCRLELDGRIIAAGCRNDRRFRITAWREHPESAARWGGVEYEIRPREKTAVTVSGSWDWKNLVELQGKVTPNPGGGTARLRLDYVNHQARWVKVDVSASGTFAWSETAPANTNKVEVVALFDANRLYGSSRSAVIQLTPPPVIR